MFVEQACFIGQQAIDQISEGADTDLVLSNTNKLLSLLGDKLGIDGDLQEAYMLSVERYIHSREGR